jgi:predicted AlkP superfamily pyrophosphatase or phosphodiesterase
MKSQSTNFAPEAEQRAPSHPGRKRRLDIFVLIDALGWRFLEGREFLSDLLPYRQPLRTVLGFSSAAIPTILTGLPPAQNGHWNLFYYDPQGSPFRWLRHLSFVPDRMLDNRLTRKLLKEMGRRMLGLGPLFECCVSPRLLPLFNWVEKRNIYDRGGISGADSVFDKLAEKGIPYRVYTYHHWTDEEILRQAFKDVRESEASFFFVYLSEMDMLLHDHWKDPRQAEQRLEWYAKRLRDLFHSARKIDADATLIVTSDHGMTPVREHYDLIKQVESLGFSMPKDYLAVYDSTMGRFWFFSERVRQEFSALLNCLPCGRILPDDELRQLGILFPDRRYGEMIFLLHPGWLISESDFKVRGWTPVGMHGYHPDDPYSDAVFLSNRKPSFEMQTIADVYWCMPQVADEVGNPNPAGLGHR